MIKALQEKKGFGLMKERIRIFFLRLRDKFPYLVWRGDEIDVKVTMTAFKLNEEGDPIEQLGSGPVYEIQEQLREIGINFDVGMGLHGRDWEWDYSLSGPINVKFKCKAKKPERRMERFRLKLVVDNLRPE